MNAAELFLKRFEMIELQLPFQTNWANGTGYFDNAVKGPNAVPVLPGVVTKSIAKDGRKMIFVGTRFGTIVVFQRYSNDGTIIAYNAPLELDHLQLYQTSGAKSIEDLIRIFGNPNDRMSMNIGELIEKIFKTNRNRLEAMYPKQNKNN